MRAKEESRAASTGMDATLMNEYSAVPNLEPINKRRYAEMKKDQTTQSEQQKRELKMMLLCELFSKLSVEDQQEVINITEKFLEKA